MRIGINFLLYTAHPNFKEHEALLERLREMGFDCFELFVGEMGADEVAKFAQKALALNMEPQCTDLFPASEADIIGHDETLRKKAVLRLKESIMKARDMGAKVFSGPFFQGLCNTTQEGPTADERGWLVENLHVCGLKALECGLRMAAEPLNRFEMHIVNTISQAYAVCEEVGLPNFGILGDTHHSNIEELNVTETYVRHIDRLFNVHISENNRGIPGSGHGIPDDLIPSLMQNGYSGNLVIEAFNANVPETLPLLRIWQPFARTEDEIALKGLQYIQNHLK